jgi:long-chain acyl-CoA synthetase
VPSRAANIDGGAVGTKSEPTTGIDAGIQTLPELFEHRVRASPQSEAYRWHDAAGGGWQGTTWGQAQEQVGRWTRAMAAMRLPPGSRVAVLLPNGPNAVWADQAAMALGFVPVPMHALDNPESIAYIVADSEAALLIVQDARQWAAVAGSGVALPDLATVVVVEAREAGARAVPLDAWLRAGEAPWVAPTRQLRQPSGDDVACIVYTSGTTGRPKGVMLTHANVLSNVNAVLAHVGAHSSDVFLSFLPLSHTFERTVGYYLPIAAGSCVAYARSAALLAEDLRTVKPTVLVSVPRIYERVYAKVQEVLAHSPLRSWMFGRAEAVGWRRFRRRQGLELAAADRSPWAWLDAPAWLALRPLVAKPLLARFGGRVRIAVSGGAPLSPAIARCFLGLGLPLLQGYGMTETSPVVAANRPASNDPATVGEVLQGVLVRLAERQELQVKGPGVMKGYWKRLEETQRAFTGDGWLRTGDQASIENGRVRILGRIKEIIVTSTGEKLPPGDLELAITADPLFQQALVVGDSRPFIAALVVLDPAAWPAWAAGLGVNPNDSASLDAPPVRDAALRRIERLAAQFPRHAVPRAIRLTLEPWTVENNLMTPTLKLRRSQIARRFASEIEAMYGAG